MQAAGRQVQGRMGAWVTTAAVGMIAMGAAIGSALSVPGGSPAAPGSPATRPGEGSGVAPAAGRRPGPHGSAPAAGGGAGTGPALAHRPAGGGAAGPAAAATPPAGTGAGGTSAGAGGRTALAVDARAWSGHGLLAVVTAGQLRLVGADGAVRTVSGPTGAGTDADPAWAPDHRWLAFLHGPVGGPPTLWVVPASGGRAVQVGAAPVGTFAWSPFADQLAFTTVDPATGEPTGHNLWTDLPGGDPVALSAVPGDEAARSLAWSPDGRDLAVDEVAVAPGSTPGSPLFGDDVLVMVPTGGGPAIEEYRSTTGGLQVAGWWPSGTGLLFWEDPGFDGGLDGLPLASLPLGGHVPTVLGTTLVGPGFVVPAPAGGPDEVAVVLGAGRGIADAGRQVAVCTMPAGTCQSVPVPGGQVGLGPAWATGGLMLVAAPSTSGSGPAGPDGSTAAMAAWDRAARLLVAAPSGWSPSAVASTGPGSVWVDPAASGSQALVVRDDALWMVDAATGAPAVRVAGPLFAPTTPQGYYGRVDWGSSFAWSEAAVAGATDPSLPGGPAGELP